MSLLYDLSFSLFNDLFDGGGFGISVTMHFNSFRPTNHYKLHESRYLRVNSLIANRNQLVNLIRHQNIYAGVMFP